MSSFDSDSWSVDETVTLIGIIKSLKELHGAGKWDWQRVANQMAESKLWPNGYSRSVPDLRDRYKKLRNDYFTARYRNRTCQYFNYLADLLGDELASPKQQPETDDEEPEQELELNPDEDIKVEQKYAQTLELELVNGDNTNRSTGSTSKMPLRCKWAEGEVEALLNIIITHKLQAPLLRKRNAKVFKLLAREMARRNFIKRPDQLRVKYHQLRRQYAKAKNGGESFEHFEDMHALLNGSLQHGESSAGEGDSDSNDSGEEDGDVALGSDSESEVRAVIPSNARVKWAEGEVDIFLDIITSMGLQSALLRKRNAKIFKLLSKEMGKRSFDKAPEKLRIKFQHLRRQYNKAKNGGDTFEHFEAMHQLLNPVKKSGAESEANYSSGTESDYNYSDEGDADTSRTNRHPDSYYWTDHEVDAFLAIIKQQNLFRALDGSKKRNFKTLAYISNILAKQSYQRTPHQLRNKLRLLLRRYREVKKDGLRNVRMLPRHFEMLEDLMKKKRTTKTKASQNMTTTSMGVSSKPATPLESDSEGSSSGSSCDLLRAAAESEEYEDAFEMPPEPTPLEVLTSISEGQKQLLSTLKESQERFLREQREMQAQFLQELSSVMRQEREATFHMLKELMQQPK
ncbi:uncharacterized protein LOC111592515 isoform X2 [Drosophila hydei]|uniref:Uncharacterized protein LOC111592515 isoform X2 n=1 Tax=Drosophila hydei TaxID=7224 RepID=A0A6J1LB87_DROHY|nr:uncharacterized protein LOC111592515 isoform X2 [Drosophila hydei]